MRVYETSEEKTTGKTKLTPELRHSVYLTFQNIRQRCTNRNNKDFLDYGGRGIECALSQEEFAEVYYRTDCCELCGTLLNDKNRKKADGRTIDRIDHDDHYSMGNLRVICRSCGRRNGKIPVRRTAKAKTNGNGSLPTPFQKNLLSACLFVDFSEFESHALAYSFS